MPDSHEEAHQDAHEEARGRAPLVFASPRVPATGVARIALCLAIACWSLFASRDPRPLAPAEVTHACAAGDATSRKACRCEDWPAMYRLVLGLPLSLDRATQTDLALLPGIGEKRAAAVVAERERAGGFERVESILRVPGIGPATLASLRPHVFVGAEDPACARAVELLVAERVYGIQVRGSAGGP